MTSLLKIISSMVLAYEGTLVAELYSFKDKTFLNKHSLSADVRTDSEGERIEVELHCIQALRLADCGVIVREGGHGVEVRQVTL